MKKFARITVSVGLLSWLAWRTDWVQVADVFTRLRLELWLSAVALYAAAQLVSGLRWKMLAKPLGFDGSWWRFSGIYFVGMFFNLVLPTSVGGDVIRAWYLDNRPGRRGHAFLSVLVDRLSGLVVLLSLACLGALLCPVAMPRWVLLSVWLAMVCALLGWLVVPRLAGVLPDKYRRLAHDLHGSLALVLRPAPLLLSVVIQAANVILVWLVGLAVDAPVPASYYWIFVPMVTLVTLIPVSINGMGVREGASVIFLAPFVPEGIALSLAFLWFCVFSSVSLCGGAVYLLGNFPQLKVQSDGPVDPHSDQGRTGQYQAAA